MCTDQLLLCDFIHLFVLMERLMVLAYDISIILVSLFDVCPSMQVVPIEGETKVNDEKQKVFSEILPEMVISK